MSGDRELMTPASVSSQPAEPRPRVIRRSANLTVGAADDPYEREADRVASEVMGVLQRGPQDAPFAETGESGATGRIRSNPYGPATVDTAGSGGPARRSIQRKTSGAAVSPAGPVGPTLTEAPGTIRRLGVWDWIWGSTKKVGEGMDTGGATMEAVDEGHKALTETALLTGGAKTGSDALGTVGGLIGGSKDLGEGVGSMREDGVGVGNTMKTVGGTMGILGGVNKGVGMFTTEQQQDLIKATIGVGGEDIGGWLDFISGGTKVVSGAYLTGKSQLQYNAVRRVKDGSRVPKVQRAAEGLMEIINEKWYMGMWDVGVGTMDMVATSTVPGYTAAAKGLGAFSKMIGGDLLWGTLNWVSGGKVRTNDIVEEEIGKKIEVLTGDVVALSKAALDGGESEQLAVLYEQAEEVAPSFAEAISKAVKELPRKDYYDKKQLLKGRVWS